MCTCEAAINSMALQGVTPLHIAAQIGHEDVAAHLLLYQAPVTFGVTTGCKVSLAS